MVKHVAIAKFKPSTSPATITGIFTAIGRLRLTIPGIEDFSWGANNSPEGLSQGYTHGFSMTFKDVATRDNYLVHPEHVKVKEAAFAHLEGAIVFDYET